MKRNVYVRNTDEYREGTVEVLEKNFVIVQSEYDGWISFWIKDPHDNDVETFSSRTKAKRWWEQNKTHLLKETESPERLKAHKEASRLVRKMGFELDSLPTEEQEYWIEQCGKSI